MSFPDAPATSPAPDRPVVTVGVDGSAAALAALKWAADDARKRHAALRVVTAWEAVPPGAPAGAFGLANEQAEAAARRLLDDALAAAAPPPSVPVERRVVAGQPAQALIAAAAGSSLLVVGARGRGGFARLLIGSVSSRCVQQSRSPVVVVRESAGTPAAGLPVVCGIDGSAESHEALRFAAEEARLRKVRLAVVTAVYWDLAGFDLVRPDVSALHAWGRQLLADAVEATVGRGPDVNPGLAAELDIELRVMDGHPGDVLGEQSADAALLVLGTRGRSAVHDALIGSVSGYCVRRARCPVALVPAPRS